MTEKPGRSGAILEAAVTVMARMGFDRMRLRDVADEAGVSIGLVQHYFDTREQLGREAFAAVCGDRAKRFAGAIEGARGWEAIERGLRYALAEPGLIERSRTWIELCAIAARDPELGRQAAQVQAAWRLPIMEAIARGIDAGEFAPVVPAAAAVDAILALIDGAEVRALIEADSEATERELEDALAVAKAIVGARSG